MAVITIAILSVVLSIQMIPSKVSLKLGDLSPRDIVAHRRASYVDTSDTQRKREQAAENVGKVYDAIPNATDEAVAALKNILHAVERVQTSSPSLPVSRKVVKVRERLETLLAARISDKTLVGLMQLDSAALREVSEAALQIVSSSMSREIRDDPVELRRVREQAVAEASRLLHNPARAAMVGELASQVLRPNRLYNEERTLEEQEKAQRKVRPESRLIEPGQMVIAKGETVQQEHLDKLEALGLHNPKLDYIAIISRMLFVILAVVLVLGYLAKYFPDVYAHTKTLSVLALMVVLSVFALRVGGSLLGLKLDPTQVAYMAILWVTTTGMLLSVLLNPQIAVVIATLLSLMLSLMLNNELKFAAAAFMTALVGIYAVANIRDRSDLLRTLGLLSGIGVLLVWILGGITNDTMSAMRLGTVWAGLVVPIGATAIFLLSTVPLERLFGLTTHISLLELADTNKPLLKRLVMEAPGTYTHSMAVGYLAETAAEAIGADSLVARVASYYHDIGKIRRPHFFVENQNIENVHDQMNPTLSALVITSHIKDGVEIAREFKLPKIVADIIVQHHGTSLVQYFYNQMADEQDPSTALEQQFRYSGPKPKTKEAAIVMLADAVEAASRCISKPTPAKIELVVNRIISDKLRDGQLDECDLSFREVSQISDSFVRARTGMLHARIEYPENGSTESRRPSANADTDTGLAANTGEPPPPAQHGHQSIAS